MNSIKADYFDFARDSGCHRMLILAIFLGVGACSGEVAPRADSYTLPEEATLEIREVFRISEPAEGNFFTYIGSIHVLKNGNLIVQNSGDPQLYEISRDGKSLGVIGREGRGPGEFSQIARVQLVRGDSLHTYDRGNMRHQVWARNREGIWVVARERHSEFQGVNFSDHMMRNVPVRVVEPPGMGKGQYGIFRMNPLAYIHLSNIHHYIAPIDYNLEPAGIPSRRKRTWDVIVRTTGSGRSLGMNLRFFKAFYLYYPKRDEVIYIRNNSNEIIGIDSNGREIVIGYLPFERFPRRDEAEQQLREVVRRADSLSYPLPSDYMESMLDRMLSHEPYYWDIGFDGERLWVHLTRSDEEAPDWVITGLDGQVLGSFYGPSFRGTYQFSNNTLALHGNRLFGQVVSPEGSVYLAGYEIIGLE